MNQNKQAPMSCAIPSDAPENTAAAFAFPWTSPPVLATGAWFKNTVCAIRDSVAIVSAPVGDLDTLDACMKHRALSRQLLGWLQADPVAIASDMHPDFYSTQQAQLWAQHFGARHMPIQHHCAHAYATRWEQGLCAEMPTLAMVLDGVGLGDDGLPWGGELLRVSQGQYQRLGYLRPIPLPGGDRAAREPWRMAAGILFMLGRPEEIMERYRDEGASPLLETMISRQINTPYTSSAGRLFDAAAGLLDINRRMSFEAQAAIALEQAATQHIEHHGWPQALPWALSKAGVLDLLPALEQLLQPRYQRDPPYGAACFHATLLQALTAWALQAAAQTGLHVMVCAGGCFLNQLLRGALPQRCAQSGLSLLEPLSLSPGDAGLSLGQAAAAAEQLLSAPGHQR
jgi:hydrogenase maturation protein HypF